MTAEFLSPHVPWAAVGVALPLFAGIAAIAMGRAAHHLAIPVAVAGVLVAAMIAWQVREQGVLEVAVGGWTPPLGIALRVDGLSAAFLVVAAIVGGAALVSARPAFGPDERKAETRAGFAFWPLAFFTLAGVNGTFVSGDLFNLYVALELLTLTAVPLVSLGGKTDALAAAFRYLLFALLGSLAYLLGAAILYAAYSTLDIRLLADRVGSDGPALVAGGLMTAGLMAKMAMFPLHGWLPPAHSSAPAPASALLSALVVKAPYVIVLRLWFEVMPGAATPAVAQALGALGAGGVLIGSLLALRQERLKLVIAYSTVAQLGYLFLVFPLAGGGTGDQPWAAGAWTGAVIHALAHALAKGGMFLAAGVFMEVRGHDRLADLKGISRDAPMAASAFGLAAVSLMGLPLSGGFTAKYLMLTSAIAGDQWWWALVLIGGGLLAAAYLFRALNQIFAAIETGGGEAACVPRARQAMALLLAALSILLGLFSAETFGLLQIGRPGAAMEGIP